MTFNVMTWVVPKNGRWA